MDNTPEIVTKTEIVPASQTTVVTEAPTVQKHMIVAAQNPKEMLIAQHSLVEWAKREIVDNKAEFEELKTNLEIAKKNGWRTVTLKNSLVRSQKRINFFEKIEAALAAGYVIIPNIDSDVVAIRTERISPKRNDVEGNWSRPNNQTSEMPMLGAGEYLSSEAKIVEERWTENNKEGKPVEKVARWADEFKDFQFPFAIAKPEILTATANAMALKIFDDIAVSPRRQVKGDPMIIGRVRLKQSTYQERVVSFLISWFVDTRDIG